MKKFFTLYKYLLLLGILLFGMIWVYVDYIVLMVAFTLLFILTILAGFVIVYLVLTVKGYLTNNKELKTEGSTGLIAMLLLIFTQLLSILVMGKVNKVKAEIVIKELDKFREVNGRYPQSLSTIGRDNDLIKLSYSYYSNTDTFNIEFKGGGLTNHVYDSIDKKWSNSGWNE